MARDIPGATFFASVGEVRILTRLRAPEVDFALMVVRYACTASTTRYAPTSTGAGMH